MKRDTRTSPDDRSQSPATSKILFVIVPVLTVITVMWALRLPSAAPPAAPPADETVAVAPQPAAPPPAPAEPAHNAARLEQNWGIRVAGLRLFAGGNMLDLRYQVSDTVKAGNLMKEEHENSYLIEEASGTKLALANTARSPSFRRNQDQLQAGRTYFMRFPNPGKQLEAGNQVTLVMGDFRAEHLVVE